jgi:hypothetical protein
MADINPDFIITHTSASKRIANCYTVLGQQEYLDEHNHPRTDKEAESLAKAISIDNKPTKYYIKFGAHGKIYNPIGMYSEGRDKKFLSKIGRKEFEFKEVNQKIFDLYVNFLTTKNTAWLSNAQREIV